MTLRLILVYWALCFSATAFCETTESEVYYQNVSILRDTFREPLRLELLKSGLTPQNAEVTAQNMLNLLIECWNSDRNEVLVAEKETVAVEMGGKMIITYSTPCMSEFLADVEDMAR